MKALLWDMDDTLLETLPARMRALAHAYEVCLGQRVDPLAAWREHQGWSLEALAEKLLGDEWRRFADAYRDYYYENERTYAPYPGVQPVLEHYHAAHVPMAVVTSKIAHGAVDELERSGLLPYFAAVVCYDDTDAHKPEPDPLHEALDRLIIDDPAQTAYVGDSPADITAAQRAGCISVAALWGTLDADSLLAATPDHVAPDPATILDLLPQEATR